MSRTSRLMGELQELFLRQSFPNYCPCLYIFLAGALHPRARERVATAADGEPRKVRHRTVRGTTGSGREIATKPTAECLRTALAMSGILAYRRKGNS
jgi:hypothetical protein